MTWREDLANARIMRAHIEDMVAMGDPEAICVECKAKMFVTIALCGAAVGIVGLAAYRIGKARA